MTFTENWFSFASQRALQHAAICTNGIEGRVIEVGSWEGRSTVALAHAVYPHVVHAVDTWEGSPGEPSADLAAAEGRDVFATFRENMAALTRGNVEAHRMGWRDYFVRDASPIRFVHIDAEHSYDEVFDNILTVRPLMARGGIICGDDAHHPPVMQAAADALGAVKVRATLWIWRCRGDN